MANYTPSKEGLVVNQPKFTQVPNLRIKFVGDHCAYDYGDGTLESKQLLAHPTSRSGFIRGCAKIGFCFVDTNLNVLGACNVNINNALKEVINDGPVDKALHMIASSRDLMSGRTIYSMAMLTKGLLVVDPTTHNPTSCSVIVVAQ
jgi:hypothetical protein